MMNPLKNLSENLFGVLFAAVLGLAFSGTSARAQLLYSNLGDSESTSSGLTSGSSYASEFTTGSAATIITAASAAIGETGTEQTLTLSLYTNSVDVPGTSLGSFTAASVPGDGLDGTFGGTSPGITLQANTNYWLVESSGSLFALGTPSSAVDAGSVFTSTPDAELGANFGSGWETSGVAGYLKFSLTGEDVVPEPSTWAMLLGGLGMLVFWRIRTRRA
jgi:hypothetical protein